MNWDQSKYPPQDTDARVFLRQFEGESIVEQDKVSRPAKVLAVGSNEEDTASILVDQGFDVVGYDLREPRLMQIPRYTHYLGDFVIDLIHKDETFDHAYSLSAIEHFGFPCYEGSPVDLDYDCKAMDKMWDLLRWGGCCWITVPYGREPIIKWPEWRIYDQRLLRQRIVRKFSVESMMFFKSHPDCPGLPDFSKDGDGIEWVPQAVADAWKAPPTHPHQTVFLKMRKDR